MRILLTLCLLLTPFALHARDGMVEGVMFYSTHCTHCHEVIEKELPPILKKYEGKLEITLVNVSTHEGEEVYEATIVKLNIPPNDQGVPTLLIGDTYLVGSIEIPKRLPDLVEEGLAQGGIPLPEIPGLARVVDSRKTLRGDEKVELQREPGPTFAQQFRKDPIGNGMAIVLLVLMVVSAAVVISSWIRHGFVVRTGAHWYGWIAPILALLGISIASYLGYIELTGNKAMCGPIGHCNEVQQSPYATLFGFLPVGILGGIGYIVILILWLWQHYAPLEIGRKTAWILPLVILVGVLLSIYLTFLEPFVIGAVCMWCLISAVIITILLWTTYSYASK